MKKTYKIGLICLALIFIIPIAMALTMVFRDPTDGSGDWQNEANAFTHDGVYSVGTNNQDSVWSQYNFAIPSGATIEDVNVMFIARGL